MPTKKDLKSQIAELTAKHELQTLVESKLPGIESIYTNDFNYKSKGTKFTFTANLHTLPIEQLPALIQQIIVAFPPTKNNSLMFAGKDDHPTGSPYMVSWDNGIRDNKVQIQWISGDFWAHISLPISFYSDKVKVAFYRKVYDTEHHYFGGISMKEINNMQIRAYKLGMFESCGYYGGDVINFIEKGGNQDQFEKVVLTGNADTI